MTKSGEPVEFIRGLLTADYTDECIAWPYSKDVNGYGKVWLDGKLRFAQRVVCSSANGAPPSPECRTIRSCETRGCVNPRHLHWSSGDAAPVDYRALLERKTRPATRLDRRTLSDESVREAHRLSAVGVTQERIAAGLEVSAMSVSNLLRGKTYREIHPDNDQATRNLMEDGRSRLRELMGG